MSIMKTYTCKECWINKGYNKYYTHPGTKEGILHRCKECIKTGRRTERERKMARVRDMKRYYNKPKRWLYSCRRGINERVDTGGNGRYIQNDIKNERDCFDTFYNDMKDWFIKHKKKEGIHNTTIERIDNLWNYSKENCKWATYKEQANNTANNRLVNYKGKEYTVSELADYLWKNYKKIYHKLSKNNRDTTILC